MSKPTITSPALDAAIKRMKAAQKKLAAIKGRDQPKPQINRQPVGAAREEATAHINDRTMHRWGGTGRRKEIS